MATVKEASAKILLFSRLYALDDLADEDPDEGLLASVAALEGGRSRHATGEPAVMPPKRQVELVGTSTPLASDKGRPPNQPPSLQTRDTITGLNAGARPTIGASNIENAPRTKAQIPQEVAAVATPRKLFEGLHFYFFPNNDVHPGRRFRINKAAEFGAVWEKAWSDKVTHLIVDRSMNYGQVMAYLKLQFLPPHVHLVDERYPADCISWKSLLNPDQRQYRVTGHVESRKPQAAHISLNSSPAQSDGSLQLKPAGPAVRARDPRTPSVVASSSEKMPSTADRAPSADPAVVQSAAGTVWTGGSELDDVIDEAKQLQHMPLDTDDETSRPGSADGAARREVNEPPHRKLKRGSTGWQERFQCMQKHDGNNSDGPNASTIALLQEMADYYTQMQDQWRPIAYRKAIAQLRNHPRRVTTKEDALKLPYIGERLAEKIEEIAYTSHLRRLDSARVEPSDQIIQKFIKIYGVGFSQAARWVERGFKTLQDLLERAELTDNQRLGIAHYEDFDTRIPRHEVAMHADAVRTAACHLDPDFQVYTMGSYRRGASASGDIDVIITHPSKTISELRALVLDNLVPHLFSRGFLVATLAATSRADGTKWHGASRLPDTSIWRRIDLLLVPHDELGAALIYFTGNDIFNRSMRLLASRKGMRLNQRGLYKGCLRGKGREKVTEGTLVEGRDERRIFEALGVPWRPPEHRIC